MSIELAFTLVRVVVGLAVAAHGAQKAFGWWGGSGFRRWTQGVGRMGFRPPGPFAAANIGPS